MPRYFVFDANKTPSHAPNVVKRVRKLKLGRNARFLVLCDYDRDRVATAIAFAKALGIPGPDEEESRVEVPSTLAEKANAVKAKALVEELDKGELYPEADAVVVLAETVHCAIIANAVYPGAASTTDFVRVMTEGGVMVVNRGKDAEEKSEIFRLK